MGDEELETFGLPQEQSLVVRNVVSDATVTCEVVKGDGNEYFVNYYLQVEDAGMRSLYFIDI